MTIGEATAVNRLADYLGAGSGNHSVTDDEARQALGVLARRAHKALQAGVDDRHVREQWPADQPPRPFTRR